MDRTPRPSRETPLRLGYFYRPPQHDGLTVVADEFDYTILTKGDERTRDQLRAADYPGLILQYVRVEAIMRPLDHVWHNHVAYQGDDWSQIVNDHPDWFMLDQSGGRLRAGAGDEAETEFFMMDPASRGWRDFFVERVRAMQAEGGWDGVFLDNVELSLKKRERDGQKPALYQDDETYLQAVDDFLADVCPRIDRLTEANLIEQRFPGDGTWERAATHLQGAMCEDWAVGWPDQQRPDPGYWQAQVDEVARLLRAGKPVLCVAQGNQDDWRRQDFAYASYLLIADGQARFRYTRPDRYDDVWMYDNYQRDLGRPLSGRRREGDTWRRDFANGWVSVNPTTWDVTYG